MERKGTDIVGISSEDICVRMKGSENIMESYRKDNTYYTLGESLVRLLLLEIMWKLQDLRKL